ncbi:CamS family sex pheromone protein, partial [Oenococcus oeni]
QSTTTGSVGSQDNTNFVNFEDDIEGFFPTISSATAQARYEDKTLTGMKITVNTSFYSVSEIKAFSTYISEVGPKYFTKDIPITISVYASNQLLAVLSRSSGSNFKVTYLYSY